MATDGELYGYLHFDPECKPCTDLDGAAVSGASSQSFTARLSSIFGAMRNK